MSLQLMQMKTPSLEEAHRGSFTLQSAQREFSGRFMHATARFRAFEVDIGHWRPQFAWSEAGQDGKWIKEKEIGGEL
jgi:hypothetical protein